MSLHEDITARILKQLEGGTVPWVKPWSVPLPYNAKTGRRYSGINVLLLWDTPYERPAWLTFHQAQDLKARIRKGEHATRIVFTATMIRTKDDEERSIPFLKWYHVFNVAQVVGLPEECYAAPSVATGSLGSAQSFLARDQGDCAPRRDRRVLRPREGCHPTSASRALRLGGAVLCHVTP